tara:strand:- start:8 stop:184 length:177 start_codon:yes stop_codon:yes gene_type:complete
MKPQKIKGTSDYSYKGFVIGKYESARGGVRWMIEKDGAELKEDFTRLANAQNYIDVYL